MGNGFNNLGKSDAKIQSDSDRILEPVPAALQNQNLTLDNH